MSGSELIGNVLERWTEMTDRSDDVGPPRWSEDPWRSFYHGWLEGRLPLVKTIIELRTKIMKLEQELQAIQHPPVANQPGSVEWSSGIAALAPGNRGD